MSRRGGIAFLKVDGRQLDVKGNATYNIGVAKRDAIVGHDGVHGFKELPQVPFIELEITDAPDLDLEALLKTTDATVILELANGKGIVLRSAWHAGEGTGNSEEGNISVRFEGLRGEEI